jgi:hypothetical protein
MKELTTLIDQLMGKGWTYAALADALGTHWDTVRNWHRGEHEPRPYQPVVLALRSLESGQPPKKRRYGPDAPQRQPKKDQVGTRPTWQRNLLPDSHEREETFSV